jgi:hypothetical protein
MENYTIHAVSDKQLEKEFLLFPVKLYRDEPRWIRPLDKDISDIFDTSKNKLFRQGGECMRWLLRNTSGEVIGRVAAFVDPKTTKKGNEQPTGGMGFFDCINDQDAANMLFDQCKSWLESKGMEAMDGPINFGNRDRWWGLLLEGYHLEPNYLCNYNFPYYNDLFMSYGFQVYFYQLTFGRPVLGAVSGRLFEKAELVSKDPNYHFRHIEKNEIDSLHLLIKEVYNKAWANRGEIPELTDAQARLIVKQMKPIMDHRLLWFGFYKDEPVAFFLSLPEVNQIFKYVNGQLDLLGKLRFVWYQKILKRGRKAFGILFGIVPEHQGKGVDGAIIMNFKKMIQEDYRRYDEYEMNWIGDFNNKMVRVAEQIQCDVVKKHATLRKLFDENKPFKRMPFLK